LLSLAGIPPFAGFLSKLFLLWSAWNEGPSLSWLVILALINSAISIVYYANVFYRMFVVEPQKRDRLSIPGSVNLTMTVAVVGILVLTVAFGLVLNAIGPSASGFFTLAH
jgi:NADH-quinone oxidoreductase subunit N